MIKILFFDFDGVIVESVDIKTNAFARLFSSEDGEAVKKIVDYHLQNTGVSRYDKFRHIFKEILKRPLDEKMFLSLCGRFSALVLEEVVGAPYVKGAIEILKNYSKKCGCFIVSATPQDEMDEILRRRGIAGFFKRAYGSPTSKSDAVKDVISKECIAPRQAVYIGDAVSDYAAAAENNINFIARISGNDAIFDNIDCIKVKDLTDIDKLIRVMDKSQG